ncbi:uncharacterized protein LOC110373065 [Helicoverpa armigera]|uniref:uncharacterized protein LOC110373065 n=1 Tax=Helicoverpa armigera TaxID=29058 RepID=UPI003082DFF6
MIRRYGKGISFVLLNLILSGRPIWCISNGAQFLEEYGNTTQSYDSFESHNSDETFTINTVGCVIPAVGMQSLPIRKYMYAPTFRGRPCKNHNYRLLESNQTHIWIAKKKFEYYNITHDSVFDCCYESFHRPRTARNISSAQVDSRVQYLRCIMFHDIIEVSNEFVKVSCVHNNKEIYEQYFTFTPKKEFTLNRKLPFKTANETMYNIIIMGIGSVSRQNFYRTMPNTLQLLKKLNAIELKGYNTVADDTFRNMIPVLVGMNNSELKTTCWTSRWPTLDSCPFIWERFKDVGYYTALVEDTSRFGMFNYRKSGFRGRPTDYYLHPFIHETENLNKYNQNLSACMGDKYYFEVLLNYVRKLTTTLKNSKLFGLFWETSMSHYNLVDPIIMDAAYVKLIKEKEKDGYLNDTILIILSDHGLDIGGIRFTKQGQIEQRLPFVFIVVPPSFRKQYRFAYHNLKVNKGRLTTAFDIHKTLIDLIEMEALTEREILRRSTEYYTHDRGISLFLKIPRNRTCQMAGISDKWCSCYDDIELSPSNPILIAAVKYLAIQTNEMLEPYPECLKLVVDDIIIAKELVPAYDRSAEWRDFNVIVRMAPGGGIFDTMLRYYNQTFTLINRMKRLNFPGFRSLCIEDPNLRLFCFCR